MDRINDLLEYLDTLILSNVDSGIVKINKATPVDIKICLQYVKEKIEFLQLEAQLQRDEQKSHHSELIIVQKIFIFELEKESYYQPEHDYISEAISEAHLHEDVEF